MKIKINFGIGNTLEGNNFLIFLGLAWNRKMKVCVIWIFGLEIEITK